jgi:hypothetical protein
MLRESLELAGGVKYLVSQAAANPGPYMALIGKIIPQQIDATIRRELPQMTREDLLELLESMRTAAELKHHRAQPPALAPERPLYPDQPGYAPKVIEHEKKSE